MAPGQRRSRRAAFGVTGANILSAAPGWRRVVVLYRETEKAARQFKARKNQNWMTLGPFARLAQVRPFQEPSQPQFVAGWREIVHNGLAQRLYGL
jgi:hypothetical protein